jgi:hypothetical protein
LHRFNHLLQRLAHSEGLERVIEHCTKRKAKIIVPCEYMVRGRGIKCRDEVAAEKDTLFCETRSGQVWYKEFTNSKALAWIPTSVLDNAFTTVEYGLLSGLEARMHRSDTTKPRRSDCATSEATSKALQ